MESNLSIDSIMIPGGKFVVNYNCCKLVFCLHFVLFVVGATNDDNCRLK